MDLRAVVSLALQASIVGTVFAFGLSTTRDDVGYLLRRPSLLLRSVLAIFVSMPVLAVVVVLAFGLPHRLEVVLVALAVSPVPPLLPNRQQDVGGERTYGLALMVTCALLAIAIVPLTLTVLGQIFQRPLHVGPWMLVRLLLVAAVIPVLAGLAVRTLAPHLAARLQGPVRQGAVILLLISGVVLLVSMADAVWAAIGDGTALVLTAFVAAGLGIGHLLGGPVPGHSRVLALSTACRHPAIALSLAATNFPEERFGGTIILYLLLNLLVGIVYLAWGRHQGANVPTSA